MIHLLGPALGSGPTGVRVGGTVGRRKPVHGRYDLQVSTRSDRTPFVPRPQSRPPPFVERQGRICHLNPGTRTKENGNKDRYSRDRPVTGSSIKSSRQLSRGSRSSRGDDSYSGAAVGLTVVHGVLDWAQGAKCRSGKSE